MKQLLYGHLPPISKTIQVKRTRHAGHSWRSKYKVISDVLMDPLLVGPQVLIYISVVWTLDIVWRTSWKRWMIGTDREREREGGKSALAVRLDDDDDEFKLEILEIIFLYTRLNWCEAPLRTGKSAGLRHCRKESSYSSYYIHFRTNTC